MTLVYHTICTQKSMTSSCCVQLYGMILKPELMQKM
jgi:hypothetical protein